MNKNVYIFVTLNFYIPKSFIHSMIHKLLYSVPEIYTVTTKN